MTHLNVKKGISALFIITFAIFLAVALHPKSFYSTIMMEHWDAISLVERWDKDGEPPSPEMQLSLDDLRIALSDLEATKIHVPDQMIVPCYHIYIRTDEGKTAELFISKDGTVIFGTDPAERRAWAVSPSPFDYIEQTGILKEAES